MIKKRKKKNKCIKRELVCNGFGWIFKEIPIDGEKTKNYDTSFISDITFPDLKTKKKGKKAKDWMRKISELTYGHEWNLRIECDYKGLVPQYYYVVKFGGIIIKTDSEKDMYKKIKAISKLKGNGCKL